MSGHAESGKGGAILHLHVGYYSAPDAREAGRMIERLANAFTQEMKNERGLRNARLLIDHVEIGSFVAFLRDCIDLAEATLTLYEHRDILAGFVTQLSDAVQIIKTGSTAVKPALRTCIDAIALPVAQGRAHDARISVVGDNNTILIIERSDAEVINAVLTPLRHSPGGSGGSYISYPALPERSKRQQSDALAAVERSFDKLEALEPTERERLLSRDTRPRRAMTIRDVNGTVVRLGNQWFVRPEGMNGGMLPLVDDSLTDGLDPDKTYVVRGQILRSGDLPNGFEAKKLIGNLT